MVLFYTYFALQFISFITLPVVLICSINIFKK